MPGSLQVTQAKLTSEETYCLQEKKGPAKAEKTTNSHTSSCSGYDMEKTCTKQLLIL